MILEGTVNHKRSRELASRMLPTIPEGVSKTQSSGWQNMAPLDDEKFKSQLAQPAP
jgi:hypothetical protein